MKYIINPGENVSYKGKILLSGENIVTAIKMANEALCKLNIASQEFDDNVFEILGMRNLSGLVGEFFARSVMKVSAGKLKLNLHQDGYPDLCLTDAKYKKDYYDSLYLVDISGRKHPRSKDVFSPYRYGGIEIKATCGSIPSNNTAPKPLVGEQRVSLITKFDWKAHHRETNHLLGVLWDFIEYNPTIVAAFYQDELTEDDWGRTVVPKEKGGRTTSVSIMNAKGIRKMCNNWIAVIDKEDYINLLAKKTFIGYRVK